jgi:hypothetical protein
MRGLTRALPAAAQGTLDGSAIELDLAVVFTAGAYGDANYGNVEKEFALYQQIVAAAWRRRRRAGTYRPEAASRDRLHSGVCLRLRWRV